MSAHWSWLQESFSPFTWTAHFEVLRPETAILVEEGSVEVYLVEWVGESKSTSDEGSLGRRLFLYQADAGQFVLGGEVPTGYALMMIPLPGVEVLQGKREDLEKATLEASQIAQVVNSVESWLAEITEALRPGPLPILAHQLFPPEKRSLKSGTPYYCTRQTLWVDMQEGELLLLHDQISRRAPSLVPLPAGCWLTPSTDMDVEVRTTESIFVEGQGWKALAAHQELLLEELGRQRETWAEFERQRIERQADSDRDVHQRAWKQMAQVLGGQKIQPLRQKSVAEPLLEACKLVGKALGAEVVQPTRASDRDPLDDIARVSKLRHRRVALEPRWWKEDPGPLIGWLKDGGGPVALIPKRPGVFHLVCPMTGKSERISDQNASRLEASAVMLYRRLPDRKVTIGELFQLAYESSKGDFLVLLVLGAGSGILALAVPEATKFLFNIILPAGAIPYVHTLVAALLLVMVGNITFTIASSVALLRFGGRFGATLASSMFDRLLTLPMPFYRNYAIGDLAQRALGVTQVRELISGGVLTQVIASFFSGFSFLLLLHYDFRLGLVAGVLLLGYLVFLVKNGSAQLQAQRQVASLAGQVNGLLYQILGALPKLRVAGAESRFFAYWADRFARQMENDYRGGQLAVTATVASTAFPVISTLTLFAFVAAIDHPIATGTMLAFLAAYAQCAAGVTGLSESATALAESLPLLERTQPILEASPELDEERIDPGELTGQLELSNVVFRYNPDQPPILNGVSVKVAPREFVAFVGSTGAGKSTTLNLLLGFEQPETGSVFFDNKDLRSLDVQAVRQQIGVVLQNARIIKDTVYRNVVSARPISSERVWEALRMVGLEEDIRILPAGLDTVISGDTFSGGQVQRLMIARAIVGHPRIIFFDEATSALDNQTQNVISRSLEDLNATRVVIAHRLSTVRAADRIYVFDQGRIVQTGTYDQLMEEPGGIFAELMARQTTE